MTYKCGVSKHRIITVRLGTESVRKKNMLIKTRATLGFFLLFFNRQYYPPPGNTVGYNFRSRIVIVYKNTTFVSHIFCRKQNITKESWWTIANPLQYFIKKNLIVSLDESIRRPEDLISRSDDDPPPSRRYPFQPS